jgi:serine palmitoyltransferase
MPSPIALTTPPRKESIFKKRSPSYLTAMRSAQSYLMALSEADARSRSRDSASTTSASTLSHASSATTLSEDASHDDNSYDNSDGLAFPVTPPTSEQFVSADHLQFGFCANENYRYRAAHKPGDQIRALHEQDPPYYILLTTYISYLFLICLGHIRDFLGKRLHPAYYRHLVPSNVSYPSSCQLRHLQSRILTLCPLDRATLPSIRISIHSTPDGSKHE